MMMQLNPTLPVFSIKHNLNGFAFAIIDYLQEHYVLFLVGLDNGEIWCLSNRDLRLQGNDTLHRISASLKAKNVKEEEEAREGTKLKDKEEGKAGTEELMKVEEKRLFVELRNNSLKEEIKLLKKRNEELKSILDGFEERNKTKPLAEAEIKKSFL